ncbi:MAG: UDP-N-acetylmuramoyl-L-alanine--D-glutamate ligase [Planctomycetota bacterium]
MFDPAGQRVTVMGLGRFGGGLGVTRFLLDHGARVHLTDQLPEADLADSLKPLQQDLDAGRLTLRLGNHHPSDFTTTEAVVVNPAVPPHHEMVHAAQSASIPLLTEIGLLIERLPNRNHVIGITGTAGKSTTAAMTAHALRASGQTVHLGGNLGGSLLPTADQITADDYVVLELSSFMLHYLRPLRWSPRVAVFTNLGENHLDWHQTFDHYADAKHQLYAHQSPEDTLITPPGLPTRPTRHPAGQHLTPDLDTPSSIPLTLPGEHNRLNAVFALTAAEALLNQSLPTDCLADFPGLPHRLQRVHTTPTLRCYNDSKSTTPDAAILAISAFQHDASNPQLHLILGGYDKSSDLSLLAQHAARSCDHVYTIGTTGPALADAIGSTPNHRAAVHRCETLDTAIATAKTNIATDQPQPAVLLLSPGCASWDQFPNYEARGDAFTQLVRQAFPSLGSSS